MIKKSFILKYLSNPEVSNNEIINSLCHFSICSKNETTIKEFYLKDEAEEIIIENLCKDNSWFVITTRRIVSQINGTITDSELSEINDFDEDTLENVNFIEDIEQYEILTLITKPGGKLMLKTTSGNPCMLVLNCVQKLLILSKTNH